MTFRLRLTALSPRALASPPPEWRWAARRRAPKAAYSRSGSLDSLSPVRGWARHAWSVAPVAAAAAADTGSARPDGASLRAMRAQHAAPPRPPLCLITTRAAHTGTSDTRTDASLRARPQPQPTTPAPLRAVPRTARNRRRSRNVRRPPRRPHHRLLPRSHGARHYAAPRSTLPPAARAPRPAPEERGEGRRVRIRTLKPARSFTSYGGKE